MELSIGTQFSANDNEKKVHDIWNTESLYSKWIKPSQNTFRFVDGPPFVSSDNLHMGHILISMMKSTALMYNRYMGKSITNKIGYDTHGLPIEMVVNNELGLSTRNDIIKYGVENYNRKCKDTINQYSASWNPVFNKIGRLFDPEDQYKTMDTPFMESVWWAFSELYKKGLVYRGMRVMPYSIACNTPLSNFEAGQNYKDVEDITAYVAFKMVEFYNTFIVAWTTTPWTLPANMALCINPQLVYETVSVNGTYYILAKGTAPKIWNEGDFVVKSETLGSNLVGHTYFPLFKCDELANHQFRILGDNFVQPSGPKEPGTSVVHIAPGFGEDDMRVCQTNGITKPFVPIDENGNFVISISELNGKFYRDTNKPVLNMLGEGVLKRQPYRHSYPFCWRTDTPLIYRAMDAWFVAVEKIKEDLLRNNEKTTWYPQHVGEGRFRQWLEGARDWCVSRNRFFGTPLPIWQNVSDPEDIIVVGSIDEFEELSGNRDITDIHPDKIENMTIYRNGHIYKRVSEVFDCWFESGCVPFAQHHYPFENAGMFDGRDYLADFICEGIDQTRGWFYTLNVLSTALFGRPAAKEIACGGLILAADGKKISKRLGNFVPPMELLEKYGADLMRLYILKLPATYGESSRFCEGDIIKETKPIMQWINAIKFTAEHIKMYNEITGKTFNLNSTADETTEYNHFDLWIMSRVDQTASLITEHMGRYEFTKSVGVLFSFIEDLTNWYLKFNRSRLKGKEGEEIWNTSLKVLTMAVNRFNGVSAPFMPFLAESIHKNIRGWDIGLENNSSVLIGTTDKIVNNHDELLIDHFKLFQNVCETVRALRNKGNIGSARVPIKRVRLLCGESSSLRGLESLKSYFTVEMNVLDTVVQIDNERNYTATMDNSLGKVYKKAFGGIKRSVEGMTPTQIGEMGDVVEVDGNSVPREHITVSTRSKYSPTLSEVCEYCGDVLVVVDTTQDVFVEEMYLYRMLVYQTQQVRKASGIRPWNRLYFSYSRDNVSYNSIIQKYADQLVVELGYQVGHNRLDRPIWKCERLEDGPELTIYNLD